MPKIEIDDDVIRKLAELMGETGLTEIEVAEGDSSIRVSRGATAAAPVLAAAPVATTVTVSAPAAPVSSNPADHPGAVTSPMVGTAYLQAEPGSPPYVRVGDKVSVGATLLIIEAMKVMNPIKSTKSGTVTAIHVEDGHPVEYGQVLMVIE